MENDRQSEQKDGADASMSDETLYVSASENQPMGEITIRLEQERKRKITIISECEPAEKKQTNPRSRRDSFDLRRQAMVNNALKSQQSNSSCSRSRSRSRGRSRGRARSATRHRSLSRTRSTSGDKLVRTRRARSQSRTRSQSIPIQKEQNTQEVQNSEISQPAFRLPTQLSSRSVIGTRASRPPEFLQLPSPLYILTEQQAIGVSEKKTVQFVTKILLTSKKLTLDDRRKLYAEMVEAEYVGTSRSSTDLHKDKDDEPEEEYQNKIYYSAKGIYIHTVQNVKKLRSGKTSSISEEKNYSNICKTKIIGEKGAVTEGWLNVSCAETVSVTNQLYCRSEQFRIGLKNSNVDGTIRIGSTKSTFDPTKTTQFSENIMFDNKNIGIVINHSASAEMINLWNHELGSFGEEQAEYRELKFFFEDGYSEKKKETPTTQATKVSQTEPSKTPAKEKEPESAKTPTAPLIPIQETPSRKSRSLSKRHKLARRSMSQSKSDNDARSSSPDTRSSRVKRDDDLPLDGSAVKKVDCTLNETLYHSLPQATSTPKSPGPRSSILLRSQQKKEVTPPTEEHKRRGALSIREHRSVSPAPVEIKATTEHEVDLDKSLSSKKPHARNLSALVAEQNKESARKLEPSSIISKATSPGSVYMYNTGASTSNYLNVSSELHKDRLSAMSPKPATTSPKGTLRVKETKVIREVRQEHGKPAEISEKKEETVKEEKVKMRGRSISPATPTMRHTFQQAAETKIVTLSAHKTESVNVSTPIKVSALSEPSSSLSGQKSFPESVQLDMLIDQKRLVFNLQFDILAEKQPTVDIVGFSFRGQKMWEKSSEWNITSANTTSHTKTIARQASNIETDDKMEGDKK